MIGFKNKEGYPSPTEYYALKKHYYPIVYICSPYAGDIAKNEENAKKYSRFAALSGYLPITPHLLFTRYLDEETERNLGLHFGNILLDRCEEVWVFGHHVSHGMKAEIKRALRREIKIRYFDSSCNEIFKEIN